MERKTLIFIALLVVLVIVVIILILAFQSMAPITNTGANVGMDLPLPTAIPAKDF